jgi:hypothetical protein
MINKEIKELRTKVDNIKEEMTQDIENLRKTKQNKIVKQKGRPIQ